MTPQKKAKEDAIDFITDIMGGVDMPPPIFGLTTSEAKQCAIISIDRNIKMFTDLVNEMGDFSNESRQVIWQLIENEENIKTEIENL